MLDLSAAKLRATPLLFLRTLAFLFEVEDRTLRKAGMVGLWTKADSVTAFADFSYGAVK